MAKATVEITNERTAKVERNVNTQADGSYSVTLLPPGTHGYNLTPFFRGETAKGPRHEIFYFDDNANINALRYDDWKISFAWIEGNLFNGRRLSQNVPIVTNLRQDPFERYSKESGQYERWWADKLVRLD